eukprot:TRINITY_DN23198_c0_g1_i1.p1 TRINITY_DN23198_c0_g1~~TRINITY_DN23198_c0_g1_i1.p1  ORF type:complete len:114 (-),score=17.83 TRINITY_DN23198_c0_g1_i1:2-343(-)
MTPTPPSSANSTSSSSSSSSSSLSYSIITSAFNHNLKVKQELLRDEQNVLDTSFDSCYIFSMRCPYPDCFKLFNDMNSYQTHHISLHQKKRQKKKKYRTRRGRSSETAKAHRG